MLDELERRSQAGEAEAQFQLAQILQHGLGVPMDEDGALRLYHDAAGQGYERAQYALGEIYMEGRITPQDLVQAFMWFSRIERNGGPLAEAAANSCEYLGPFMSAEQRAEAARLASDDESHGKADTPAN